MPPSHSGYQLYSSRAPAAALALHWVVTSIVILATVFGTDNTSSSRFQLPAYYLGSAAFAYGLDLIWFSVMGIGVLCFRLWPGSNWRRKSPLPHYVGVAAAAIFGATNAFPLIAIWIPDPAAKFLANTNDSVNWYAPQTYGIAVLVFGLVYWLCFRFYVYQRKMKGGELLEIIRIPIFLDRGPANELVQLYEIVKVKWTRYIKGEKRDSTTIHLAGPLGGLQHDPRVNSAPGEGNLKRMPGKTNSPEQYLSE